jgi:hypothetical protein
MKKTCLFVCVLLLLLLLPCAVSALGNISVSSTPAGAQILVDSIDQGVTPNTIVNVTSGPHNVLLQKTGYVNNLTSVTVGDGETVSLSVTLLPSTTTPTITSITPSSGINNGLLSGVDIIGTGFSSSPLPTVKLNMTGQSDISGIDVHYLSPTEITCGFPLNGATVGTWNVVVTNSDGGSVTKSGGFTVIDASTASTVTSITPSSGTTNTTVTISSLVGTGFQTNAKMRLTRNGYNPILGLVSGTTTATQMTGSFNLANQVPGTWTVCVLYDGTEAHTVCGPTFIINAASTTSPNGTINVKSAPTTSKVFLNSVYQGYTPMTLDNIAPGTYTVMIRSAGFNEYSESVKVTAGNTSYVTASLVLIPEVTTAPTTAPKTTVSTVKTTAKSTAKVPTPWPSATPTPASSVSVLAILGAVGVGLIVLRKP